MHDQTNVPLRPWAYALLALIAASIGLASSAVTADFFVLGLERTESDAIAREALIAAGILMIITELAAFGIAALLPRAALRSLRVHLMACGVLLLAFETTTIYVTQVTLVQTSDTVATSSATRANDLRTSIANQRAAAQSLRDNGTLQSQSSNAWSRQLGAIALRDAIRVEQQISPLLVELATLESAARPTLTDVLGTQGMLAYTVARAMLISVMGLVMFGAAGALLRAARSAAYTSTPPSTVSTVTTTGHILSYRHGVSAAPKGFAACLPSLRFIAIPIAALAVSPIAFAVPSTPTVTAPLQAESQSQWASQSQYQRVRDGVIAGRIKPSVRGIQSHSGGGTALVRRYLKRLETDGVTQRFGQGWVKKTPHSQPQQMELA